MSDNTNDSKPTGAGPSGAARPASRPATRPGMPAKPGTEAPPASPRRTTGGASARMGSSRTASSRAAAAAPAESEARESHRPQTRTAQTVELLENTNPQRVKYVVWGAAIVLFLAAVAFGWAAISIRRGHDEADAKVREDGESAISQANVIMDKVTKGTLSSEDGIKALEPLEELVKESPGKKADLANFRSTLIGMKEADQRRKDNLDMLAELEKNVDDPNKLDDVAKKLPLLQQAASTMDKEFQGRTSAIGKKLIYNGSKKLVDEAEAKSRAAGDPKSALMAYDVAVAKFHEQFRAGLNDKDCIALYKALVQKSDELAVAVETPEYEAGVQVRDMLGPTERKTWKKTAGSNFASSSREMVLTGEPMVDKDGKEREVVGKVSLFGWATDNSWSDIYLELEFTIVAGGFELMLRDVPGAKNYTIPFTPKDNFELGKPYKVAIRVKGSAVELYDDFNTTGKGKTDTMKVDTSRVGGVSFGLKNGAKVTLSTCNMKLLRPFK